MAKLTWNEIGDRRFEIGVDRGVLAVGPSVVAWNGLAAVSVSPSGGEAVPYYLDGVKYLNRATPEEFGATLEAFTYPDEFAVCDGTFYEVYGLGFTAQPRKEFHLAYRTLVGNDVAGVDLGYKIHFVYNLLASPSELEFGTVSDELEPTMFSWELTARPMRIPGRRPTAHLIVDSTRATRADMDEVERILYGTEMSPPSFPLPADLVEIFGWEMFRIEPSVVDGLAPLVVDQDDPDLKDDSIEGIYSETVETDLTPTATDGIYSREE